MRNLYGQISGMAIPTLALDGPGGKDKVPLTPRYLIEQNEKGTFKNYLGEICT
jgi:lysine 2,3-aminomutase